MMKHRPFALLSRLSLLLLLCLLLSAALAQAEGSVINLIDNPDTEYAFEEGATLLEIVFPRVYSSDCAIVRYGDATMMIDASSKNATMQARIQSAMAAMGVTSIDIAFNSHPHADHIGGFPSVLEYASIGKLLLTFPEENGWRIRQVARLFREQDIPVEQVGDGDVLSLGEGMTMQVIQRSGTKEWKENDRSALLLITYGERTILFAADLENRAQKEYVDNPPECGLKADILKYPHHGLTEMNSDFYEAISPEFAILTCDARRAKERKDYLTNRLQLPYVVAYTGITRLRTDGHIWVVDTLAEDETI